MKLFIRAQKTFLSGAILLLAVAFTLLLFSAWHGFLSASRTATDFTINSKAPTAAKSAIDLSQVVRFNAGATPEQCLLTLRFHGPEYTISRARYWFDFVQEDLQQLDAQESLLCAEFSDALITNTSCEESNGRAWCQLDFDRFSENSAQQQALVNVVITPSGIANTRNGVVFLHDQASALVFRHELGHALGLADEYLMHRELATQFCTGGFNFSPLNMVITENNWLTQAEYEHFLQALPWQDYVEQDLGQLQPSGIWQLGSVDNEKIGLFAANTCAGTGYYAWKPIADKTFMQQHEIGVLPLLYLQLIEQRLLQEIP